MHKIDRVYAVFVAFSICSFAQLQGEDAIKTIVIGKDHPLRNIKEIKSFTALFFSDVTAEDDISFLLTLEGKAIPKNFEHGFLPTLILRKDGKLAASAHLHAERSEETNEVILEWAAVPGFDEDSFCFVQIYPQTEKCLLLKVPFSAATVKTINKDKKMQVSTIADVRKFVSQRRAVNRKPLNGL